MSTLTYNFRGVNYTLTEEERSPFNNNRNNPDRVPINSTWVFHLKNGREVIGNAIDIHFLYAVDGDVDMLEPLQAEFTILTENGDEMELTFLEIENHNSPPFKPSQFL